MPVVVTRRGESDLLCAGNASLDGSLVDAQERGEPHAVLHDDDVCCPLLTLIGRKLGFGIPYECGEPVQIPVECRSVDPCKVLMGLGEGPEVEAEGQVRRGQEIGVRNAPK